MTEPEGLAAALLQLSAHAEKLAALDHREAAHATGIRDRIAALATLANAMKDTLDGQAEILAGLIVLAGLGRAGLPARLRAPVRGTRRLLGAAPALPLRPGLAQRAVVRALPPAPAHHRHTRRPGRMADPPAD